MDNGHIKGIFSSSPEINDDLNSENWQKSLEISKPVDLPSPEKIAGIKDSELIASEIPTSENQTFEETTSSDSAIPANSIISSDPAIPENPFISSDPATPEKPSNTANPDQLGQITSVESHQDFLAPSETFQPNFATSIRIDGDHMSKSGIEKIDRAIEKLDQDRSLSSFYDEIRGPLAKEAQDAVGHINLDNTGEAA